MKKTKKIEYKLTDQFTSEVIGELLDIDSEKGLTPENIVEEAKDEDNPLHDFFEWDDKEASQQYRLVQARNLINKVEIIIGQKKMYAFESVNVENNDGTMQRMYKPMSEIINNIALRKQIILSALNHVESWKEKYASYNEFGDIIGAIEKTSKKIKSKWQKKN